MYQSVANSTVTAGILLAAKRRENSVVLKEGESPWLRPPILQKASLSWL